MKTFLMAMLAVLLMSSATAFAESSISSPLIGNWSVDISRLPIPPDARPKSVTISFKDGGDGKWLTRVDVISADGNEMYADSVGMLDGKASPVSGNLEADTAAVKMPVPNVLVMMLARGNTPASTRVYAVSADGQSMIETATYFDEHGSPVMRTNYFTRL